MGQNAHSPNLENNYGTMTVDVAAENGQTLRGSDENVEAGKDTWLTTALAEC